MRQTVKIEAVMEQSERNEIGQQIVSISGAASEGLAKKRIPAQLELAGTGPIIG